MKNEGLVSIVYPSSNQYGIADLLLEYQALELPQPLLMWNEQPQAEAHSGTYAFYTTDRKFSGLQRYPERVFPSGCQYFVEPNFSSWSTAPLALALGDIWWKRQISRFWQSHRKRLFVDLHVTEHLADMNLLGVPEGWGSYMTRASAGDEMLLDRQFARASARAAGAPLFFVVYSGGIEIEAYCQKRGWVWFPDKRQRIYDRKK